MLAAARIVLVVAHGLLAAAWFGSMTYSLFVVQPRAARFFAGDDDAYERWVVTLATGNRWRVLTLVAGIALSGVGLVLLGGGGAGAAGNTAAWYAAMLAKTMLLAAAVGVFSYVSWWHWPRRVFATKAELPALRRVLRRCAYTLAACVAAAMVLGFAISATPAP
jgi:hypothetical protein